MKQQETSSLANSSLTAPSLSWCPTGVCLRTHSQVVSLVCSVVDGQLGAQVADVGIRSVLQQDVDAVWVPRACGVVQDAVAVWCLGVHVSTLMEWRNESWPFK